MKSRIVVLFLAFIGLFALLVARAFYLQMLPNKNLDQLQKRQYMTVISLPAQRGKIIDRRGEELATTIIGHSLYADPSLIRTPRKLSKKLSQYLGLPKGEIYSKLISDHRFVWLKRRLDSDQAAEIKSWEEPGLAFIEEGRRAYPNQNLFSQVMGVVGAEGEGLEGIEKKYDAELRGEKKSIQSRRDARGRPLVVNGQMFELKGDGATVETTIDKDLQYELERQLEQVTQDEDADKAIGVILDPSTGEVLAMGSYPSFDPNAHLANGEGRRNRAIQDIYEPGSTFKVVAVSAALHSGRIQPNTKYFCENGKYKLGKHIIHEAESAHNFGWLTLAEILQVSSNIGSTKIAADVGQKSYIEMLQAFGFGSKLSNDFLGEANGLIQATPWADHLFANISFGHGVGVTALQMASAYATIANGGKLMRPFLVKRVVDSENHVIEQKMPQIIRQVLTPKESAIMTLMLTGVTEEGGTGTLARVDGYPVAGKTGTAQKVNPHGRGYMKGAYLSSFAGFVPANNPQFVIYVMVDHPKKHYYGAQVAAPVFHRLASFALHRRGFMPIVISEKSLTPSAPSPIVPILGVAGIKSALTGSAINGAIISASNAVVEIVPNFTGLTMREVTERIKGLSNGANDLAQAQLIGSGVAYAQSPEPGQKLTGSQKIKIYFHSEAVNY